MDSNLERCCRLCAEEQEVTIMIFSEEAEAMLLQNKLNKYLLLEVDEDDKLPKNICIKCCSKLHTVCEFIDAAHKAQEILLSRSIVQDQLSTCSITTVKTEPFLEEDNKVTEMEISVDPMMVLQNCDETLSPNPNENCQTPQSVSEDVSNVDGEYVTIKLIRRGNNNKPTAESGRDPDNSKESKPFPCFTCKRGFLTELALKNHLWVHTSEDADFKRYRCSQCLSSYDFKSDLIAHLKDHRNSGMCQLCGRVFRTEANLTAHMALHEDAEKSYTCKVCGRSYNTKSNLKTHSVTHSNDRPYNCHICKKSFKRNQDLKFHINQHTGNRPYKCPFCEKCFASSGNCYSHRSRMHPGRRVESKSLRRRGPPGREIQAQPKPRAPPKIPKVIYKYYCSICDNGFTRRDNYTYHMYQHTGQKPFQCSNCPEKFVTRRGLLIHHDKEHPGKDRPLALISKNALLA